MARSCVRNRSSIALFLLISTAIPVARFYGQDKPEVAPPSKSDSYAEDEKGRRFRVQQRDIAGTNFRIAGVDLAATGDFFTQVKGVLGKTGDEASGDAGDFNAEVCYQSTARD